MIPPWKFATSSFSFGAWRSRPAAYAEQHDGSPVLLEGRDHRNRSASRVNTASGRTRARCASGGLDERVVVGVIHGFPPCMRVIFSSMVFGVMSRTCASNSSAILSGCWFGTSRMLTFAIATA